MIFRPFSAALLAALILTAFAHAVHARSYIAYISDSTSSSVIYWLAKEVGIFKKTWAGPGHDLHQRQRSRDSKSDRR